MGMFLRRGQPPARALTVVIAGTFSSSRAYVTVGDVQYTSAATVEVNPGDVVGIYISSDSLNQGDLCYVAVDGETVQTGRGTYLYTVLKSSTITLFRGGSSGAYYYYCEITTS